MGRIIITNHHQPSPRPIPPPCSSVPCSRASARTTTLNKSEREKPARHYRTLFAKILATFAIRKRRKCGSSPPTTHDRDASPTSGVTGFSRYLGRQLTPAEKIVISALEKAAPPVPHPLLIIDSGHHDSRPILRAYQNYRLATSPQGATALLCTPRQPQKEPAHPTSATHHLPAHRNRPEAPPLIHAPARRPPCPHILTPHTRHPQLPPRLLHPLPHPRPLRIPRHPPAARPWSPYGCDTGHITRLTVTKTPPARTTATRHSHHHPRH